MSEKEKQVKINELRIGNLVNHKEDSVQILSIGIISLQVKSNLSIGSVGLGQLSPIAITHEWLKRLGFKFHMGDYVASAKGISLTWGDDSLFVQIYDDFENLKHIKYVHQLQNLVHALTGEELEVGEVGNALL